MNSPHSLAMAPQSVLPLRVCVLEPPEYLGLRPTLLVSGKYLIGSDRRCEIRVTADGIEPRHALLLVGDQKLILKAFDPRTWVNDFPATETTLRVGDRISIGPISLMIRRARPEELCGHSPAPVSVYLPVAPLSASIALPVPRQELAEEVSADPSFEVDSAGDSDGPALGVSIVDFSDGACAVVADDRPIDSATRLPVTIAAPIGAASKWCAVEQISHPGYQPITVSGEDNSNGQDPSRGCDEPVTLSEARFQRLSEDLTRQQLDIEHQQVTLEAARDELRREAAELQSHRERWVSQQRELTEERERLDSAIQAHQREFEQHQFLLREQIADWETRTAHLEHCEREMAARRSELAIQFEQHRAAVLQFERQQQAELESLHTRESSVAADRQSLELLRRELAEQASAQQLAAVEAQVAQQNRREDLDVRQAEFERELLAFRQAQAEFEERVRTHQNTLAEFERTQTQRELEWQTAQADLESERTAINTVRSDLFQAQLKFQQDQQDWEREVSAWEATRNGESSRSLPAAAEIDRPLLQEAETASVIIADNPSALDAAHQQFAAERAQFHEDIAELRQQLEAVETERRQMLVELESVREQLAGQSDELRTARQEILTHQEQLQAERREIAEARAFEQTRWELRKTEIDTAEFELAERETQFQQQSAELQIRQESLARQAAQLERDREEWEAARLGEAQLYGATPEMTVAGIEQREVRPDLMALVGAGHELDMATRPIAACESPSHHGGWSDGRPPLPDDAANAASDDFPASLDGAVDDALAELHQRFGIAPASSAARPDPVSRADLEESTSPDDEEFRRQASSENMTVERVDGNLDDLRAQLAQMFDLEGTATATPAQSRRDFAESNDEAAFIPPEVDGSRVHESVAIRAPIIDSLPIPGFKMGDPEPISPQTPEPSGVAPADDDPWTRRLRELTQVASVASAPPPPPKPSAEIEPEDDDEFSVEAQIARLLGKSRSSIAPPEPPVLAMPVPLPMTPTPVEVIAPQEDVDLSHLQERPKHRQDKDAVREEVQSFRAVAQMSARTALAKHSWNNLRNKINFTAAVTISATMATLWFGTLYLLGRDPQFWKAVVCALGAVVSAYQLTRRLNQLQQWRQSSGKNSAPEKSSADSTGAEEE